MGKVDNEEAEMASKKDTQQLFKRLRAQGFTIAQTRSGHFMIRDAAGSTVTVMPSTPSEGRGLKNAVAALKRAGYDPNK